MPVYNAGKYLPKAIESILRQTFSDFELLIVNDGSTDDSEKTIRSFTDKRIRYFTQTNQGLIATLNRLIQEARGEYLARMDQDDVAFPERLKIQADFLDKNPDVGLLGAWVQVIDQSNDLLGTIRYPLTHSFIRATLALKTCFAHGTIMMRKALNPVYSHEFLHAEDYDLWCRLAMQTRIATIPRVLYQWRFHPSSTSSALNNDQKATARKIRAKYAKTLLAEDGNDFLVAFIAEKGERGRSDIFKLLISLLVAFPFSKFTIKLLKTFFRH